MSVHTLHPSPFWADCGTTHFQSLRDRGTIADVIAVLPVAEPSSMARICL